MEVPSLNLKLNLKIIDETSCLSSSNSSGNTKSEQEEELNQAGRAQWDYSQNGANWGNDYPECVKGQQSPINLLDAYSKYG